jgi:DegV family protein with EDD domain
VTVGVVTDSACSLPADLARARGVRVVPMVVTSAGALRYDGDVGVAELVAVAGPVTTSGPAPADLAAAIDAADDGHGVVVLTVSQHMSGTYQAARLAAGLTGTPVAVVDTGTAAGAQGLVVLAAAARAERGASLPEVEAHAREVSRRVRLVATLPTLDHLARGGHVPQAVAWARRWLGLQPVLDFHAGHVRPLRPARTSDAAMSRILSQWERSRRPGMALHAAVIHALDPVRAERLRCAVLARQTPDDLFLGSFSAVMVAHTGPGLVGLAWWWEDVSYGAGVPVGVQARPNQRRTRSEPKRTFSSARETDAASNTPLGG